MKPAISLGPRQDVLSTLRKDPGTSSFWSLAVSTFGLFIGTPEASADVGDLRLLDGNPEDVTPNMLGALAVKYAAPRS